MRLQAGILLVCALLTCEHLAARDLRIENVSVVSPERDAPLTKATVVIRKDRIVSVGSAPRRTGSSQVIDGTGLYLAPGLIDSHVHVGDLSSMTPEQQRANPALVKAAWAQTPRSYLYFGFTTLLDLLGTGTLVKEWNAHPLRPDLYFCGGAAVMDGYPMNWMPKPQRYKRWPYLVVQPGDTVPDGMDAAAHTPAAVVKRMHADGAICVKSFFERGFGGATQLPVPSHDIMSALIRAARKEQMPVFLHANSSDAQAFAIETGVDAIVHGMWHWTGEPKTASAITPAIQKTLDDIVKTQLGWQATMQVLHGELDVFDPAYLGNPTFARVVPADLVKWYGTKDGQHYRDGVAAWLLSQSNGSTPDASWNAAQAFYAPFLARNRNATAYLAARKAHFLFGSDTPSSMTYANPPGMNGWLEMRRLAEAGLTARQIFRAATLDNARIISLDREIGSVEAGKRANLLLLRQDPTRSVEAYNEIVKVIIQGQVVDREELAADRQQSQPSTFNR